MPSHFKINLFFYIRDWDALITKSTGHGAPLPNEAITTQPLEYGGFELGYSYEKKRKKILVSKTSQSGRYFKMNFLVCPSTV